MPENLVSTKDRNNFRFWFPIDDISIEKAVKNGKPVQRMVLGGVASTKRRDTDKESIAQNFDLTYLQERGIVNWNHSKEPEDVIGEPVHVKMVEKGLYVKSELYADSKKAQKVFELAEVLKNNGSRRLGYSIEGKAVERDPMDPTIVTKAIVTNLALTISPKNPDSIVDIIKGHFNGWSDDELAPKSESFNFDANGGTTHIIDITREDGTRITVDKDYNISIVAKAMTTDSGRALIKEDLDKKVKDQTGVDKICKAEEDDTSTYLSKEEVVERLMTHSVIDLEKANQIFENLNTLAMSTKDNKSQITDEMLSKAIANVSKLTGDATIDADASTDISKGDTGTTDANTATAKAKDEDEGANADANAQDDGKKKDTPKEGKAMKKAITSDPEYVTKADFDAFSNKIMKCVSDMAIITKANYDMTKSNNDELQEIQDSLDETPGRKSMKTVAPRERNFQKANESDEITKGDPNAPKGKERVSVSLHKNKVVDMMDRVVFKDGTVNQQLAKAMTLFESSGEIHDASIVKAVQDEFNVELCK